MASRLQLNGSNSFELFGVAGATPYTICSEVVAAANANQPGVTVRGPSVLRRTGPAYDQDGVLLAAQANQASVVLDGLAGANGLTVQSQAGSSRGALLTLNLAEAGTTFNSAFAVGVATSSRYVLLQSPTSELTRNCTGTPNGCRQVLNAQGAIEVQEWDTRLSGTTITPVGSPQHAMAPKLHPGAAGGGRQDSHPGAASLPGRPGADRGRPAGRGGSWGSPGRSSRRSEADPPPAQPPLRPPQRGQQRPRIQALPLERLEALADALLDFSGAEDLTAWLAAESAHARC